MPTATQQERGSVEWGASDPAGTQEDSPPQHHERAAAGKWREEAACPRPHSRKGAAWNGERQTQLGPWRTAHPSIMNTQRLGSGERKPRAHGHTAGKGQRGMGTRPSPACSQATGPAACPVGAGGSGTPQSCTVPLSDLPVARGTAGPEGPLEEFHQRQTT